MSRPVVPAHLDAERAVLGALLVDARLLGQVTALEPASFFLERHHLLFQAIGQVAERGTVEPMAVAEQLRKTKHLEAAGGPGYLAELVDETGTTALFDRHVAMVRDRAQLRRIMDASTAIGAAAMTPGADVGEVIEQALQLVIDATRQATGGRGLRPAAEAYQVAIEEIQERYAGRRQGLSTGFAALDETVSFLPGDFVVVAGRPGMGKSALMAALSDAVIAQGHAAAEFHLEMSRAQVAFRRMAPRADTPMFVLASKPLHGPQVSRAVQAAAELSTSRLYLDDTPSASLADVTAAARRHLAAHGGLGSIVVDYLQLMRTSGGRGTTRDQQIGELTRGLKALAKELQCVVIAGSQLNRDCEKRTDKRPLLADLRESGSIEADASVIIALYRDEYYHPDTRDKGVAEAIVLKNRNGATETVKLRFEGRYTRFSDMEPGGSW